jgi:hypothetical protein
VSALADALIAKHADVIHQRGPQCHVEKSGRRALVEALGDRTTFAAISRILEREGTLLSAGIIQRHLRGNCRCKR